MIKLFVSVNGCPLLTNEWVNGVCDSNVSVYCALTDSAATKTMQETSARLIRNFFITGSCKNFGDRMELFWRLK